MNCLKNIYPSIYSANHGKLLDECKKVESIGFQILHVDIQDHLYASEISFGMKLVKILRESSSMKFDLHLILSEVENYLDRLEGLTAIKAVTIHPCGERFPERIVGKITKMGYSVGLAFTLKDPVEEYAFLRDKVKSVLICTASADGKGNSYNPYSVQYIKRVRNVFPMHDIVVDGDVNINNLVSIRTAGATHFVMGREIFETPDLENKTKELNQLLSL